MAEEMVIITFAEAAGGVIAAMGKYELPILCLPKWVVDCGAAVRDLSRAVGLLHSERDQGGEAGASSWRPGDRAARD